MLQIIRVTNYLVEEDNDNGGAFPDRCLSIRELSIIEVDTSKQDLIPRRFQFSKLANRPINLLCRFMLPEYALDMHSLSPGVFRLAWRYHEIVFKVFFQVDNQYQRSYCWQGVPIPSTRRFLLRSLDSSHSHGQQGTVAHRTSSSPVSIHSWSTHS